MRYITISVLSVFLVLPVFANVRMPVVNVASGGVSARAAFGEDVFEKNIIPKVAAKKTNALTRTRAVKKVAPSVSVDVGENIIAMNDVLTPRRPSNDLWAKNDVALRMPSASEFSVIRSDSLLPEESLDEKMYATAATGAKMSVNSVDVGVRKDLSDLDAQIARMSEIQRQITQRNNVANTVRAVMPRTVTAFNDGDVHPEPVSEPVYVAHAEPIQEQQDVSLRRLVVPMDSDDVIVRSVEKNKSPRITAVRDDMSKMSPSELRRAFRKTFLSENKHFSTYSIDDAFDVSSDMSESVEGFTARSNLSEGKGIKKLEIKITFRNDDSALTRANYTLLSETAALVANRPSSAIQVAIPQYMTTSKDGRKLAARRLAIIEQSLTDNGVSLQRIVPVLSQRKEPSFVLRVISNDQYETLTQHTQNIFGDNIDKKTYKSMTW